MPEMPEMPAMTQLFELNNNLEVKVSIPMSGEWQFIIALSNNSPFTPLIGTPLTFQPITLSLIHI